MQVADDVAERLAVGVPGPVDRIGRAQVTQGRRSRDARRAEAQVARVGCDVRREVRTGQELGDPGQQLRRLARATPPPRSSPSPTTTASSRARSCHLRPCGRGQPAGSSSSAGSHSSTTTQPSPSWTGRTTRPCQVPSRCRHSRSSPGRRPWRSLTQQCLTVGGSTVGGSTSAAGGSPGDPLGHGAVASSLVHPAGHGRSVSDAGDSRRRSTSRAARRGDECGCGGVPAPALVGGRGERAPSRPQRGDVCRATWKRYRHRATVPVTQDGYVGKTGRV